MPFISIPALFSYTFPMRQERKAPGNGAFIHTFFFDSLIFLFSPSLCLLLILSLAGTPLFSGQVMILGVLLAQPALFAHTVLTHGHVASVMVRSYLNAEVFLRHKWKVLLAPVLLLLAMNSWHPVFVGCLILMGFWNMYHYALQNFGIARLYDAKKRIFSRAERSLDLVASLAITLLPIAIGSENFMHLLNQPEKLVAARLAFLVPAFLRLGEFFKDFHIELELLFFAVCAAYFGFHAFRAATGRAVSWQKVLFMSQLALVFYFGWLYFHWVLGFASITLLHSVQYYGLLSLSEREALSRRLGITRASALRWATVAVVLAFGIGFGIYSATSDSMPVKEVPVHSWHVFPFSLIVMVNLIHFWFDGFIWKRQLSAPVA